MDVIHALIQERNALETEPFSVIIDSNIALNESVYDLEHQNGLLQIENTRQKDDIDKLSVLLHNKGPTKTEMRQQDKIQKLEHQLNEKQDVESQLSKQKESNHELEKTITTLKEHISKKELNIDQLNEQLEDAQKNTKLAEKQYDGLKDTIRRFEEENETLTKQYEEMEGRILSEKEKFVDLMNKMNVENEELKKKIEMLTELNKQEKRRFIWSAKQKSTDDILNDSNSDSMKRQSSRRFGSMGVVVPSVISQKVIAHQLQATCLRYDTQQGDCIATASEDSTVRLWNTGNGQMLKSFRGGSSNVVLDLDLCGSLIAACGTDKMCRIWNTRTERLIHQLVGHSQKVTSARFITGDKSILTASADRSMKVWDITRNTYRQTITLRHSSTSYSTDVSYDSVTAVSGHLDGGVRFWDLRNADRTADISELHSNGVTSVNFNPKNNAEVLTAGRDSILKLIDVRKSGQELQSFSHAGFRIDLSYAGCAISPNGKYAAAGSSNGQIFIWNVTDGKLEAQLDGHTGGVVTVGWERGGSNGQQFASVDKKGCLLLWA